MRPLEPEDSPHNGDILAFLCFWCRQKWVCLHQTFQTKFASSVSSESRKNDFCLVEIFRSRRLSKEPDRKYFPADALAEKEWPWPHLCVYFCLFFVFSSSMGPSEHCTPWWWILTVSSRSSEAKTCMWLQERSLTSSSWPTARKFCASITLENVHIYFGFFLKRSCN